MRKWITLLVIVFTFSTVNGQNSKSQRQKQLFQKETVKSAASSTQNKEFKDLSPARQKQVLGAQKKDTQGLLKEQQVKKQGTVIPLHAPRVSFEKATPWKGQVLASDFTPKSLSAATLFFEDFEASSTTEPFPFPAGWIATPEEPGSNYNLGWSTVPLSSGGTPVNGHSGTRYAAILYHPTLAHDAWAYTPAINLTAGKTYKISFWVRIQGWSGTYERLEVKLGTAATPTGMTTLVYDNGQTDVADWAEKSYEYAATTTGSYYIGFHSFSPADVNVTFFDDVKVEEVITTIPAAPTGFTVTPDAGGALSAVLNWTNPSTTEAGNPLSAIASLVIQRDGTTIHTISNPAVGSAGTWTDNTPTNGDHTYTIYATNSDGDGNSVSQTVFVGVDPCVAGVTTFPYDEGAEGDLDCWKVWNADGGGAIWGISTYAHSGDYAFVHQYSAVGNQDGWLISPKIVVPATGVYQLSFWSRNQFPTWYGKNSVLISTTSDDPTVAGTYTEIWTTTSVVDGWEESVVSLAAYAGQEIYLAFRYQGEDAHSWYLDDINIKELLAQDAGVTAITNPVSGQLTASEDVKIRVKNFGSEALSEVPVKLQIDEGAIISGTVPTIGVDAEVEYTFPAIDFSVAKSYTIKAWTEVGAEDTNLANDAATVTVVNVGDCIISTFPYNEGVEVDASFLCWNDYYYDTDGSETGWAVTAYEFHSGERSIYHADGPAGVSQDGWLVSPKIKIPTTGVYDLSFWSANAFVDYYGKNSVLISTASGDPADGDFVEVWSPESVASVWGITRINLANYANEEIYIAFRYEGDYAHAWYLDDLQISELTGKDAGVTAIISPATGPNLTATEPVKIKVKNYGAEVLTNIPVKVTLGTTELQGNVTIPIGEEVEYTFSGTLDLSEVKTYSITATTALGTDDVDASNDAFTVTVTNDGNVIAIGSVPSYTTCDVKFVDDGKSGDYSASGNQVQTITFYPGTPGNKVKAEFTSFYSEPYSEFEFFGMIFTNPGDTLYVYDGNVADPDKLLGALTDDLTGNLPDAFRSLAADGSLTFVFIKQSWTEAPGWEANITCYTPQANDAGVNKILSPIQGGSATAEVKVQIKNYGSNAITSTPVAYKLNGGTAVTETFTGNIASGASAEFTFAAKVDVSAYTAYTLEAYTLLPGDGDASNDKASISFSYKESITLYGYRVYPSEEFLSFNTADPTSVTVESTYTDGTNSVITGEYIDGFIYAFTSDADDLTPRFVKIDADTYTKVSSVEVDDYTYDLTYDYSSNTLYGLTSDGELATVDIETGAITPVTGVLDNDYMTLAIDLSGQLYGVGYDDGGLYKINKTTGASTLVGATGFLPNYLQKMAFDHNTGRLFWAFISSPTNGSLVELDLNTGVGTNYGLIGTSSEVAILYTPYTAFVAPELVNINIEDGAIDIDPELSIILTFSQDITSSKLGDIILKTGSDTTAITPSITGSVLTIAHAKLADKTTYDLLIPTGTVDGYDAEIALSFTTIEGVGIAEVKSQAVSVYPNPAKGAAYISYVPENSVVSIKDATGRTVGRYTTLSGENVKIELPFAGGIYFIQISGNNTTTTQKLIIK